ncbi:thiamine-phosphate kinase, partial [Escherichia coli]|nr:thiamine-phosphate kinase [Escherichia coli]
LNEIAEASCVSIEIDESMLPIHSDLPKLHPNWKEWALFGGEDFELTGTVSKEEWEVLKQQCAARQLPITKIGHVREKTKSKVILKTDQTSMILEKKGYNHFK